MSRRVCDGTRTEHACTGLDDVTAGTSTDLAHFITREVALSSPSQANERTRAGPAPPTGDGISAVLTQPRTATPPCLRRPNDSGSRTRRCLDPIRNSFPPASIFTWPPPELCAPNTTMARLDHREFRHMLACLPTGDAKQKRRQSCDKGAPGSLQPGQTTQSLPWPGVSPCILHRQSVLMRGPRRSLVSPHFSLPALLEKFQPR